MGGSSASMVKRVNDNNREDGEKINDSCWRPKHEDRTDHREKITANVPSGARMVTRRSERLINYTHIQK